MVRQHPRRGASALFVGNGFEFGVLRASRSRRARYGAPSDWLQVRVDDHANRLVSKDKSPHTSGTDSDLIALQFAYERLANGEDDALSLGFFLEAGSNGKSGNFGRPRSADHPIHPLATVLG